MGRYLDLVNHIERRPTSEVRGCDKSDRSDQSPPSDTLLSHKSLLSRPKTLGNSGHSGALAESKLLHFSVPSAPTSDTATKATEATKVSVGVAANIETAGLSEAAVFLADLRSRGVRIEAAGNSVIAAAPAGEVSAAEWHRLRTDDDVMAILRAEAEL